MLSGFLSTKSPIEIDHGFNIEVRVAPLPKPDDSEKENREFLKAVESIQSATANMQFLKLEGKPILRLQESKEKAQEIKNENPTSAFRLSATQGRIFRYASWTQKVGS